MAKRVYSVSSRLVAAVERRSLRNGVSVTVSGGAGYAGVSVDLSGKADRVSFEALRDEFESMFERVEREDGSWYILAKRDFLGSGRVTARNEGGEGSGGEGSDGVCAGRIADLLDVALGAPLRDGEALVWREGAWRNEAVESGLDEGALGRYLSGHGYVTSGVLAEYATEAWVLGRGFLTEHQDVSGLLPRVEFEEMFERVERADGSWYIRAKADVLGDGRITARNGGGEGFGGEGSGGGECAGRIADLLDVALGAPLRDGEALVWREGAWRNEAVESGLDEGALGRYLRGYGYVTSEVLGGYVTVGTEQEITGRKRFGADVTVFTGEARIDGKSGGSIGERPHLMFHIPDVAYAKFVLGDSGALHLLRGGATDFNSYAALGVGSIAVYGGTGSQFLKADGSVDSNSYVNKAGDTMSGVLTLPYSGLVVNSAGGDTATRILKAYGGGVNNLHYINFGNAPSNGNAGEIMYQFVGAGSADNNVALGFYGGKYVSLTWGGDLRIGDSGNWKKVWNENNDGSGSGLDADMVDGYHLTSLFRQLGDNFDLNAQADSNNNNGIFNINKALPDWSESQHPFPYGTGFNFSIDAGSIQILVDSSGSEPYFRNRWWSYGGGNWKAWKRLAFTSSNVASATRLQGTYNIWGQSFYGNNVSGQFELNGVHNGTLSLCDGGSYRAIQSWQSVPLCLNPAGNSVIVGTTSNSSGARLHVNGDVYAAGRITGLNTSDERLKENIRPIEGATGLLRGLGGFFVFDYRAGAGESMRYGRVGLIFQKVRGHFAELMGLMREDGYGALNYISPDFINLIGASVLEVDGKVAELRREVAELRRENETLKRIVTGKGYIEQKGESEA